MTLILTAAVLILAAIVVALTFRVVRPAGAGEDPSVAASEAAKIAASEAMTALLAANREARQADSKSAEAALREREAEIRRISDPLTKNLERIETEVKSLAKERQASDATIKTLLEDTKANLVDLGTQTGTLVKALRQPQTRGKWGEVQLRRCVEVAGMTEHVDFELQMTLKGTDVSLRPDALVLLPGDRRVVIDSKVPLDAYLEVLEAEDEATRKGEQIRHSRQTRDHVTKLASKRYQDQFSSEECPDFVVCFVPSEAALHAAFEQDPTLYEYALDQKVLIATPTTLIGLLRTIELGWRQERIAEEAQQIAAVGRDLHHRVATFLEHFAKAGRGLTTATAAYNDAVGSLESRVLPQVRRFEDLGAASGKELSSPAPVDNAVRSVDVLDGEAARLDEGPKVRELPQSAPDVEAA
jgi:DNA recombination protein RmuC